MVQAGGHLPCHRIALQTPRSGANYSAMGFSLPTGRCIDGFQDWESAALPLFQHSGSHGGFQGLLFLAGQLAEVGNVSFCQGTLNDWVMLLIACSHPSYCARWIATCRFWGHASEGIPPLG